MSRLAAKGVCFAGLLATLLLAAPAAGKDKPGKRVNLNTATVEELATLPGVGPVVAARIVRHRQVSGRFRTVDELLIVRGISRKRLERLRPYGAVSSEPR